MYELATSINDRQSPTVAFSPDGTHVLVRGQLHRIPDLGLVHDLGASYAGCFSPDGSKVALGFLGWQRDQPLARLCDVATGADLPVSTPQPNKDTHIDGLCFVPSQPAGWCCRAKL